MKLPYGRWPDCDGAPAPRPQETNVLHQCCVVGRVLSQAYGLSYPDKTGNGVCLWRRGGGVGAINFY